MKIIQTPVRFYPAIGGVEKYALDLSSELAKNNNVKVICADEPKTNLNESNSIKISRLRTFLKIANTNITLSLPFRLLREKFDLIHTYFPTPWSSDWSVLIAKLKGKKAVISYCNDIKGSGISDIIAKIYNNTVLRLTLRLADKIIIIGPNFLETSKYLKKYSNKIIFIPIGVDTEKFKKINIDKEKNTLFFLSILDEYHQYKGLDYLLEAIRLVKKENPDVKLIVGGKGKLQSDYIKKAKGLGIESNVKFIGFVADNELISYYNKCECFILPSCDSEQEGFGIVLLEALSCDTPVIATDVVGIAREIKENNAGIIIEPKKADQLASAINTLLRDPAVYTKNIDNLVSKYCIQKTAQQVRKLYNSL
ncbi:MAG: glycosyltransferase family 4 protein [Patescibacteria group bacterium]|jgi:glycosyltransferase involved in cell wall biosynthesis